VDLKSSSSPKKAPKKLEERLNQSDSPPLTPEQIQEKLEKAEKLRQVI